jgi:hypothetical protein
MRNCNSWKDVLNRLQGSSAGVVSITHSVDCLLQLDGLPASLALVRCEDPLAGAVFYATSEGFGGESSKHDGVDGPDARTGKHGHGELRDHRHVESDNISCAVAKKEWKD